MPEITRWEYRVVSAGSFWNMPRDDDIEALLNDLGEEGWEVVSVFAQSGNNRARVVAKRPLSQAERRRRSRAGVAQP